MPRIRERNKMDYMFYTPWGIEEMTGYKPKTTFWEDFCIADKFGKSAVQDTYNRAFKAWKDDVEYVTELVMVLNWKSWQFAGMYEKSGNEAHKQMSVLYEELYFKAHNWCCKNLKGDDLGYYLRTTD